MDKNTIIAILLMALVFFGIMWLRPDNEGAPVSQQHETEQAEQASALQALTADSLTDVEHEWLVKNIIANGKPVALPDGRHAYTLDEGTVNLTLSGDSLYGTVTVDGSVLNWHDVVTANPAAMTLTAQRKAVETVRALSLSLGKFGKFSRFLAGTAQKTTLNNDVLALELNTKSGSITRAELKKYDTEYSADETSRERRNVVLFDGARNKFDFELPLSTPINTSDLYFNIKEQNDSSVLMALEFEGGAYWGIRYTLGAGENYVVRVNIEQQGMEPLVQSNNTNLVLNWMQDLKRQERGRMFEERNSAIYYKATGGSVEHLSENNNDSEQVKSQVKWIGFKNQFFSSVIVAQESFSSADFESDILKNTDFLKSMHTRAIVDDYKWNDGNAAQFSLFLGPNLYPLLSSLDEKINAGEDLKLTKMIPLGWSIFRWINTGIVIPVFNFLGKYISNYGIIILLLTIFIKLILFPFTWKSYKSQAKMRVLAPDIKAINDKYPGNENAMTRQQKTMALYSKAGASPFSGCLPMLLQMPILFAMFSFFPSCIELRGQSFLWAHDLSAPDAIVSWNANIPLVTAYFGNHISLFCLLMTATNIIYTWLNMQSQSQASMPGMKWMMYLMPVFFMIFFNNYASGLSYYYFLSLLITIIQTYAFRFVIKEEDVRREMAENAKKPRKKSGFMARLEQMQKEQQRMLAEQNKRKR